MKYLNHTNLAANLACAVAALLCLGAFACSEAPDPTPGDRSDTDVSDVGAPDAEPECPDGSCSPSCTPGSCARGVCDADRGCVDAASCDASAQCLAGKRCLEGVCTPEEELCEHLGEGGCEEGFVCDYDEESQSAECAEPTQCETSRECFGGRVCAGALCVSAPVCEPEAFEPNDSSDEATDFALAARNDAVDATLCAGDKDVYHIDVPPNQASTTRRNLHVVVEFPRREVGLGPVTATIHDPEGEEAASRTSGDDGTIDIDHRLPISAEGSYRLTVEYASDDAHGGIHYRLAARVEPRGMDEVCETAPQIPVGEPIEDSTARPHTTLLESRCSGDDSLFTNLHAFELEEASQVAVRMTADNPEDFVVGVRSDCRRLDTEWACKVGQQSRFGSANDLIELEAGVLEPGRYFVVVQNPEISSAGPYELEVSTTTPGCSPADNSCIDLTEARTCSAESGSWSTEQCARGCEPHTGSCRPTPAETCERAPIVNTSTTVEIDWSAFSADYRVPEDECVPVVAGTTQTDGPDAVYQVSLPPEHALHAVLRHDDSREVSLYVLEDCLDPSQSCLGGANEDYVDAEEIIYRNETDAPETVFLVADAIAGVFGTAELEINIDPVICEPWETRCHDGDIQRCNDARTGWTTAEACQWGCSDSGCNPPPGEVCDLPLALTPGQTFSGAFSDYVNDVDSNIGRCDQGLPDNGISHGGPDAFFSIALNKGDLLTAELDTDTQSALYIFDNCQAGPSDSCLRGEGYETEFEFYAPQTATYFIGVDAYDQAATEAFELTVDVQSGAFACQPGGTYCDPTTDELVLCNIAGTRETGRRQCANGCELHACNPPPTLNDTCGSPYTVSGSTRILDDLGRFNDDYDGSSSCDITTHNGGDAVYEITLAADEMLIASTNAQTGWGPSLYLVSDCADVDGSCKASADTNYTNELTYHATSPETLYLVVDAGTASTSVEVVIDIDIRQVDCQHGQTQCAGVPGGLDYCNELGIWEPYACSGTCNAGACDTPSGGICQDAIPVSAGQTVSGGFMGENNVELGGRAGACALDGASESVGPDTFYRIDLQQGDLLEVDLQTNHQHATVHILESCTGLDTCQPGTSYRADSAGPVWVMVDSSEPRRSWQDMASFQLTFDVTSGATCTPSTWSCVDGSTVGLCDDAGSAYETSYTCPSGCARGGCQPDLSAADSCASAPNVGPGIVAYADPADLTDSPLTYEVTVAPNEILHASTRGGVVTLFEDCADRQDTIIEPDAAGPSSSTSSDVYWRPEQSRTIKVAASPASDDAAVRLMVEKLAPECSDGQRSCSPSADATRLCEPIGLWRETPCQTTCSNGRCDAPTGEICEDAVVLSPGMSVAGNFGDFNNDSAHWANVDCSLSRGANAVYEIQLSQGDMLRADLFGPQEADVAILDGCVGGTCVMSSDISKELDFVATEAGPYYLVVDKGTSLQNRGREFVLEVDVEQGRICQPNTWRCDSGVAQRCGEDGTTFDITYQCSNGCGEVACAPPATTNDTCSSAITVDSSAFFEGSFDDYTDDYQQLTSCAGQSLQVHGSDSVYEIVLAPDEVLSAELEVSRPWGLVYPKLLLADSCAGQPGACVAESDGNFASARLTYQAQQHETLYLVADSAIASAHDYTLDIDISQPNCTPGTVVCADSDTLELCPHGFLEQRECEHGCANAACNTPPNDVCGGAIAIPRDGEFHTQRIYLAEDYSDQVNFGTGHNTCSGTFADGPDAIYRIDAQAGDVLTAYWRNRGSRPIVWLTGDCADAANECIVDSSAGRLEQTFTADATYWLIVDSRAGDNAEHLELDVRIAPQICQPGESSCDPSTGVISYCNAKGTAYKDYACQGGCDDTTAPPSCAQPRGEQCVDAIDATQGGSFTVNLSNYDDSLAGATSCMGRQTLGGDAIFRVDLSAGQTVEASTQPPQGEPAALYILNECHTDDVESACQAGHSPYGGQLATVSYTAASVETVYVVVDSWGSSTEYSDWMVDITVQ